MLNAKCPAAPEVTEPRVIVTHIQGWILHLYCTGLCETFNTKIIKKNNILNFSKYIHNGLTRNPTVLTSCGGVAFYFDVLYHGTFKILTQCFCSLRNFIKSK